MNQEIVAALDQLELERGLDRQVLIKALEEGIQSAYAKNMAPSKVVEVRIDPDTMQIDVLEIKRIVEKVENPHTEISLEEALAIDPTAELEGAIEFPVDTDRISRITVQTAKQVLTQKIREAEREMVYNEYRDRQGQVVTAIVQRIDIKGNVFVDLGRGEAIIPRREQIPTERYTVGQRLKVYLSKVELTPRGPSILASRADKELLKYLMQNEIPEIAEGTVEIKAIAREAGQRSKVAVYSSDPNVDPIGACIGHRGGRIQAVTAELQRERVDIIQWDPSAKAFIQNALSPAKITSIEVDPLAKTARVTVGADQLSLAIGKGGQNVRLAARLTDYKIDLVEAAPGEAIATSQRDALAAFLGEVSAPPPAPEATPEPAPQPAPESELPAPEPAAPEERPEPQGAAEPQQEKQEG